MPITRLWADNVGRENAKRVRLDLIPFNSLLLKESVCAVFRCRPHWIVNSTDKDKRISLELQCTTETIQAGEQAGKQTTHRPSEHECKSASRVPCVFVYNVLRIIIPDWTCPFASSCFWLLLLPLFLSSLLYLDWMDKQGRISKNFRSIFPFHQSRTYIIPTRTWYV